MTDASELLGDATWADMIAAIEAGGGNSAFIAAERAARKAAEAACADMRSEAIRLDRELDEARDARKAAEKERDRLARLASAVLNAETYLLHDGYDDGPGGGNYVYVDVIRTDSDEFIALRSALSPTTDPTPWLKTSKR